MMPCKKPVFVIKENGAVEMIVKPFVRYDVKRFGELGSISFIDQREAFEIAKADAKLYSEEIYMQEIKRDEHNNITHKAVFVRADGTFRRIY